MKLSHFWAWSFFLLPIFVFGQTKDSNIIISNENLSIRSTVEHCQISEDFSIDYISFEFENHTNETIQISYKKLMQYSGKCLSCSGSNPTEDVYEVTIAPKATFSYSCDSGDLRYYSIIKKLHTNTEVNTELLDWQLEVVDIKVIK